MSRATGAIEEESAQKYLKAKGYSIVERNWRKGRAEIDIIALQEDTLVFVEVKFRNNTKFGLPEEKLSESQQNRILEAAENYLIEKNWNGPIRFDVIAITRDDLLHMEDAFH